MKKFSKMVQVNPSKASAKNKSSDKLRQKRQDLDQQNYIKIEIAYASQRAIKKLQIKFNHQKPLVQVKQAIYKKLSSFTDANIQQIIGFQTVDSNYAFDYQFQQGLGYLTRDYKLNCLYMQKKQGLEKYKICCCLAIGGFSKVFLIRSKLNGKFFAAKFIDKKKAAKLNYNLLQNERQISLQINSSFLVKTYQFLQTSQFYIFIMDYCAGGELFYMLKHIRYMSQDQARVCFIQILLGIEYLHSLGYMYRDLKPQNILLDSHGYLKIADFGLSKPFNQRSFSFCGSIQYMAPEIINGKGHSKSVDFYCLGALLYQMLVGRPPFYDSSSTSEETKNKILNDSILFPEDQLTEYAKDFIRKLTAKKERQRLGYLGGCREIMAHPWLGKINRSIYEEKRFQPPFSVNLHQLNFDPDQIGQSERMFQKRINLMTNQDIHKISYSNDKKRSSEKIQKTKSESQKKVSANNKGLPYKTKSTSNIHKKPFQKSPYFYLLKSTNLHSVKKLKTEMSQEKSLNKMKQNIRLTECDQKIKLISVVSKLRKKCKYNIMHKINQNQQINQTRQGRSGQLDYLEKNIFSLSNYLE